MTYGSGNVCTTYSQDTMLMGGDASSHLANVALIHTEKQFVINYPSNKAQRKIYRYVDDYKAATQGYNTQGNQGNNINDNSTQEILEVADTEAGIVAVD